MDSYKIYLKALRPWSFTATITPIALGTALAYRATGALHLGTLCLTCITALSIHAAGNLINTYFDYLRGVDTRRSDDRTLVDRLLNPRDIAIMAGLCYIIGISSFMTLLSASPQQVKMILIFCCGISSSFFYTGGLGLKYVALGDILIFLTFGPIVVLFSYFAQGASYTITPMLYAIPLALNTEAILHSNNTRDMVTDEQAGVITLAILLGKRSSYRLFQFLIFAPYIIFTLLSIRISLWFIMPMVTLPMALRCQKNFMYWNLGNLPEEIAKLNLPFGLLYVLAISLS